MIDMFKPAMHPDVLSVIAPLLTYDENGRMYIGEGKTVKEFEDAFSKYCGLPHNALALNSGTSALELAAQLLDFNPDDEVITTPQTCTATQTGITLFKAKLVWADIDPITGLIDPDDVARKITPKTKAIIAVNWGGRMPDYKRLKSFGIPVVEDAAHGQYKSTLERGDYIIWSTQAIKSLTTIDGGLLFTPKEKYDDARLLRWYGLDRLSSDDFRCKQNITLAGRKLHMNNVNAAIGLKNLEMLPSVEMNQKTNAAYYCANIIPDRHVYVPSFDPHSTYWIFTILCQTRDELKEYLKSRGIDSSQVHARNDKHDIFKYAKTVLPNTDYFDAHQLSIPVHFGLSQENIEYIVKVINEYVPNSV